MQKPKKKSDNDLYDLYELIDKSIKKGNYIITLHAKQRMVERGIICSKPRSLRDSILRYSM